MRLIAAHRPELAERLERLREHSPDRFRRVLVEALVVRMEEALNEVEREPGPPRDRPERGPRIEPEREGPLTELRARVRELEERHEQLEVRSHELADQLRRFRRDGTAADEREPLRDELARVVNEQFEVRTELRKVELERIERDLHRLREALQRMQRELEHRAQERDAIVQRRIDQLLGADALGW